MEIRPRPQTRTSKPRRTHQQLNMEFPARGGKRRGAGRKPVTVRGGRVQAGLPHRRRPAHKGTVLVHVTLRIHDDALTCMRSLRKRDCYRVLHKTFVGGCSRDLARGSFRVCHYSIQRNHLHFIVEASSREALSRGVQGLSIRMARGLNKLSQRTGKVFGDRYHEQPLTSPRQVRNTLVYVLNNGRRHGEHRDVAPYMLQTWLDPYSSALYFDGWDIPPPDRPPDGPCPVAPANTWLLAQGWRRHGRIPVDTIPAPGRQAAR